MESSRNGLLRRVIIIGGGLAGLAAARSLQDASIQVVLLESRNRLGGRVYTDYSFGFPVDMGASWLHGVCKENPLAPLIGKLGLPLYRTSGDNSVLYDHDLESYALFDNNGLQVPQELVTNVGEAFEKILKETEKVRDEHNKDMSILKAFSIVMQRRPDLRQEGLANKVLQWYLCRMEGWFSADADTISLRGWDQEVLLPGGHGLMVRGYRPVVNTLAKGLDIRLGHGLMLPVKLKLRKDRFPQLLSLADGWLVSLLHILCKMPPFRWFFWNHEIGLEDGCTQTIHLAFPLIWGILVAWCLQGESSGSFEWEIRASSLSHQWQLLCVV